MEFELVLRQPTETTALNIHLEYWTLMWSVNPKFRSELADHRPAIYSPRYVGLSGVRKL